MDEIVMGVGVLNESVLGVSMLDGGVCVVGVLNVAGRECGLCSRGETLSLTNSSFVSTCVTELRWHLHSLFHSLFHFHPPRHITIYFSNVSRRVKMENGMEIEWRCNLDCVTHVLTKLDFDTDRVSLFRKQHRTNHHRRALPADTLTGPARLTPSTLSLRPAL